MASANRTTLAYGIETAGSWGVSPGGTGLYQRMTGETLANNINTITSDEIRGDRQVTDRLVVGLRVLGDVNFELSYGAFDQWLAMALQAGNGSQTPAAAWSAPQAVGPATNISFTAPATIARASGLSVFAVNDWIKVSGATNAANNGVFKISAVTDTALTMKQQTFVNESAGANITLKHSGVIVNAAQFNSMTIERKHADLTVKPFSLFTGVMPNTMELGVRPDQIARGRFGMIGKVETIATASTFSGFTNAATNKVLDGIRGVKAIFEADASVTATEWNVNINNNLSEMLEIGTQTPGPIEINVGEFDSRGTFRSHFRDSDTIYQKFLDSTDTGIAIVFGDAAGNRIVIDHPSVLYSEGRHAAEAKNRPIIRDLSWQARMHPTELITTRIVRIAA